MIGVTKYLRIFGKVIKSKGGNVFVEPGGNVYYGISNEFKAIENGLLPFNLIN